MYQNYLITGATGFLGRAVVQLLLAHSCRVLALVMDKDPLAYTIPENVEISPFRTRNIVTMADLTQGRGALIWLDENETAVRVVLLEGEPAQETQE